MEQMDLEIREVDAATRPKYKTRIDSYRAELERLSQEYLKAKSSNKNHSGEESKDSAPLKFPYFYFFT